MLNTIVYQSYRLTQKKAYFRTSFYYQQTRLRSLCFHTPLSDNKTEIIFLDTNMLRLNIAVAKVAKSKMLRFYFVWYLLF